MGQRNQFLARHYLAAQFPLSALGGQASCEGCSEEGPGSKTTPEHPEQEHLINQPISGRMVTPEPPTLTPLGENPRWLKSLKEEGIRFVHKGLLTSVRKQVHRSITEAV
jgi:hypothetical protein